MLPPVLKTMDVFGDGVSWYGQVNSFTPPTLGRQFEEHRGSFARPVKIDVGGTALECEFKTAGYLPDLLSKMGQTLLDGNAIRFVGAYQRDDTGAWQSVEIYARGRIEELDRGEQKVGDVGEHTVKMALVYYREVIDGTTYTEIDILNHIELINGVDRLAEARAIIGR